MQLFIDSSDTEEIREALDYGVSGVTTNPTTMAKAAEGMEKRAKAICELVGARPVSLQVTSTEYNDMLKQMEVIHRYAPNVIVKIPATPTGLQLCCRTKGFARIRVDTIDLRTGLTPGLRFNLTLVFSPTQTLVAAQGGAWCVSPFLCRWKDHNFPSWRNKDSIIAPTAREGGVAFLRSIVAAVGDTPCKVLAASIRSVEDVEDAIVSGCDICTVSLKVLRQMVQHPKTEDGVSKFMSDWEAK